GRREGDDGGRAERQGTARDVAAERADAAGGFPAGEIRLPAGAAGEGPMIALLLLLPVAPDALVRTKIQAEKAWVGQAVTLAVEVLVVGQFDGATALDVPTVSGAIVYRPDDRSTLDMAEVDGKKYVVQRHEFYVYAQRAGEVRVPPFAV